jgi:2-methylisocitrate lyase-like PEP mutase family enzyme
MMQTGAGTTMSRLGMADLGVATMNDMRDHAAMIASISPTVPLVADADTGYGGTSFSSPYPPTSLPSLLNAEIFN